MLGSRYGSRLVVGVDGWLPVVDLSVLVDVTLLVGGGIYLFSIKESSAFLLFFVFFPFLLCFLIHVR